MFAGTRLSLAEERSSSHVFFFVASELRPLVIVGMFQERHFADDRLGSSVFACFKASGNDLYIVRRCVSEGSLASSSEVDEQTYSKPSRAR